MSEWIKIRIKDFYKDAVGETEYAYVSHEVYEALADTFRREAHAEEMRDLRHTTADGYTEGETENPSYGNIDKCRKLRFREHAQGSRCAMPAISSSPDTLAI